MNVQAIINKLNQQIKLLDEGIANPDTSDTLKKVLQSAKTLAVQIRNEIRKEK